MATPTLVKEIPSAFLSYSWDSPAHKEWAGTFGVRLRADGIDAHWDEFDTRLGDQLPHFMEKAIRESEFVLIICTPRYKQRSEARQGGVGYEGNIITGELLTHGNERKLIPLLREGEWSEAAPSWLLGKRYADLRGVPYSEAEYKKLLDTILGLLPEPPSLSRQPGSAAIQNLDSLSVTNQQKYADLVNSAIKAHQAAKNRILILNSDLPLARGMLSNVETELSQATENVARLAHEMNLLSSVSVADVAKDLAAHVLMMQAASLASQETVLDGFFKRLVDEIIPRFREVVRRELASRGGAI